MRQLVEPDVEDRPEIRSERRQLKRNLKEERKREKREKREKKERRRRRKEEKAQRKQQQEALQHSGTAHDTDLLIQPNRRLRVASTDEPASVTEELRTHNASVHVLHEAQDDAPQASSDGDKTPTNVTGKKRKRSAKASVHGNSYETIDAPPQEESVRSEKRLQVGPASPLLDGGPTISSDFRTDGYYTDTEMQTLSEAVDRYRRSNGLSQVQLNDIIQSTRNQDAKMFWPYIYEALPSRKRTSLSRCVRRKWHNYTSRGVWTDAEDDMLREAYRANPNKWTEIGVSIARMPEDCRDRWRNYAQYDSNNRRTDIWTEIEEAQLLAAIYDCIAAIATQRRAERAANPDLELDQPPPESLINWQTVGESIGGSRSRLQCYHKWKAVSRRAEHEQHLQNLLREDSAGNTHSDSTDATRTTAVAFKAKPISWRIKRSLIDADWFCAGDKLRLLCDIEESETIHENRIPWPLLLRKHPQDKWKSDDRKVAFANMKRLVAPQPTLQDLIQALKEYLLVNYGDELDKYYFPQEIPGNPDAENTQVLKPQPTSPSSANSSTPIAARVQPLSAKPSTELEEKTETISSPQDRERNGNLDPKLFHLPTNKSSADDKSPLQRRDKKKKKKKKRKRVEES